MIRHQVMRLLGMVGWAAALSVMISAAWDHDRVLLCIGAAWFGIATLIVIEDVRK